MTGKERVKISLNHREPDRVPLIEIAARNKLASKVLGKKANIFFSGDVIKNLIEINIDGSPEDKKNFIINTYTDQLKFFSKMGIDAVPIMPGGNVLNSINPFGYSGMNDNPAVEVKTLSKYEWKIIDEYGFWSVVREYKPESDKAVISDHVLLHEVLNS